MPGPRTEDEALKWIQESVRAGRYLPAVHFNERLLERKFDMADVFKAIESPTSIAPYSKGSCDHGGTCWRVFGLDVDAGRRVAVGVEAFLDKHKRRVCICTVFDPEKET
jgi:hypothetical protein